VKKVIGTDVLQIEKLPLDFLGHNPVAGHH